MRKNKLVEYLLYMAGYETRRADSMFEEYMQVIERNTKKGCMYDDMLIALGRGEVFKEVAALIGNRKVRSQLLRQSSAYIPRPAAGTQAQRYAIPS